MAGAKVKLAKLEKVEDLRQVWPHEARNFSRWLCEEDALEELGAELGIDIAVDETESNVGEYRADILASEKGTGRKIVIENQLEETDHDHLGKLLVYASGKGAEIVVWIVRKARDEHRRAIEWLNEHTDRDVGFFLVEVELWRIGGSAPAVKFNAVERPNEWAKELKPSGLTPGEELKLRFWTAFRGHAEDQQEMKAAFSFKKPLPQGFYELAVGSSSFWIELNFRTQKKCLQAALYFHACKELFGEFRTHEAEIGKALDAGTLTWKENSKDCRFYAERDVNPDDESSWPEALSWLCAMSLRLKDVAMKYGK